MHMRTIKIRFTFVIATVATAFSAAATFGQTPSALQQKLIAEYALTTPTADNTAIVTAGCVLTLQKRGLTASAISSKVPTTNSFKDKDVQIRPSASAKIRSLGRLGVPGVAAAAPTDTRLFVNGEKIFVTKIDVDPSKEVITFDLLSDAFNDIRYRALLRFEFPKGTLATADIAQIQPILDQAIKVDPPAADAGAATQTSQAGTPAEPAAPAAPQAAPAAPAAPAEAALPPIAPPPPPPADPKSIENGMTKDQVVAIMGQPVKMAKVGNKDIYTYPDLKITFVNGKMTDAQ